MVLVTDLVSPAAESATGPDVHVLKLGQELLENTLTLESRCGVTVVELAVVGGDDLILGLDHLSVDETLDTVTEEVGLVNRLLGGLGNLQHDGPVRTLLGVGALGLAAVTQLEGGELDVLLRLVVGGVVGEDGGTVERSVVLGEVQPALVTDALRALTSQTDTNDVGRRVVQTLAEADELLVAHGLDELVHSHGGDELLVLDGGAVGELDGLLGSINLADLTVLAEAGLLLGESVGNSNPDTTGTIASREAESGVGAPVTSDLVQDDVLGDELQVGGSNTLTQPLSLHLFPRLGAVQ